MFVTVEGLQLWVETAGPENEKDAASTVLLLHGFPDSHKLWQSQVRSGTGYWVF
jgi:pimeloyl-ACP methyl ester carboxylesterase